MAGLRAMVLVLALSGCAPMIAVSLTATAEVLCAVPDEPAGACERGKGLRWIK